MEVREMGDTGVLLSEVGIGTWKFSGGVEPIQRAIALGATHVDTAEMYGTEDVVGQALQGRRDQVFLATKVSGSHLRYDEVMSAADGSLGRLGVDHIDMYIVHWPNSRVPIAETMGAMEDLVEQGKVRYIGVSNFSVRELKEAQGAMTKHRIVSNQVLYNLRERRIERDLIPYCKETGVTVVAYTPLDSGSLADKPLIRGKQGVRALETIAGEVGKTKAQVALNWCLSRDNVITIPKANRVEHVEENCGASGWMLSSEQVRMLDEAFG